MMTRQLIKAGGRLKRVHDTSAAALSRFQKQFSSNATAVARDLEEILEDQAIDLVVAAPIPDQTLSLAYRVLRSGKDLLATKPLFTSVEELEAAKLLFAETGRRCLAFFAERLHVECASHASLLIAEGAIGEIVHISITGPHRIGKAKRPDWFFESSRYGGILTDIGSHHVDQFLHFGNADDGRAVYGQTANVSHPLHPQFEDFGQAVYQLSNGVSCHSRVDWLTPDGLSTWGDGRVHILGTDGFMELRKYVDLGRGGNANRIYLVDKAGEHVIECQDRVGFPFFSQLIVDCIDREETSISQDHVFKACEMALQAQELARSFNDIPTSSNR